MMKTFSRQSNVLMLEIVVLLVIISSAPGTDYGIGESVVGNRQQPGCRRIPSPPVDTDPVTPDPSDSGVTTQKLFCSCSSSITKKRRLESLNSESPQAIRTMVVGKSTTPSVGNLSGENCTCADQKLRVFGIPKVTHLSISLQRVGPHSGHWGHGYQ
jgi:hypothetical protein